MDVVIVSFVIYLVAMIAIGILTYRIGSESIEGYFLGKRRFGPFTIALTHQATAMSGYMFQGMPGKGYSLGLGSVWVPMTSAGGPLINFTVLGKRLRRFTERVGAITIPDFLESRYYDKGHIVRIVSVIIIFIFLTAYTAAQTVAMGRTLEFLTGIDYKWGAIIGALTVLVYVLLGGFAAAVYTDVVQAILMFIGAVVVPALAIAKIGGFTPMYDKLYSIDPKLTSVWVAPITLLGFLSIGYLGYLGQPQLHVRFMAIKNSRMLKYSLVAAVVWAVIALYGVTLGGVAARVLLPGVKPELSLMALTKEMLPPVFAGILIAAMAAAIMSSANSYLLVVASALARDIYHKIIDPNADQEKLVWISRISVLVVSLLSIYLALGATETVFKLVLYAWAGLACSFGPVVIFGLYWKRATKEGAIAGMIVGAITVILWKQLGLSWHPWYEMIPGFVFASIAILIVSLLTKAPPKEVQEIIDYAAGKKIVVKGGSATPELKMLAGIVDDLF
ncbi:sodium/proline symporter [Thermococcus sp.]|uniref:sodium/proline symporter n=1 Tax=Thermococcus sp. TaxID=35749 RepID=UPI002629A1C5|nr:sodium/proline symporter [Thermococcus sp.]